MNCFESRTTAGKQFFLMRTCQHSLPLILCLFVFSFFFSLFHAFFLNFYVFSFSFLHSCFHFFTRFFIRFLLVPYLSKESCGTNDFAHSSNRTQSEKLFDFLAELQILGRFGEHHQRALGMTWMDAIRTTSVRFTIGHTENPKCYV